MLKKAIILFTLCIWITQVFALSISFSLNSTAERSSSTLVTSTEGDKINVGQTHDKNDAASVSVAEASEETENENSEWSKAQLLPVISALYGLNVLKNESSSFFVAFNSSLPYHCPLFILNRTLRI